MEPVTNDIEWDRHFMSDMTGCRINVLFYSLLTCQLGASTFTIYIIRLLYTCILKTDLDGLKKSKWFSVSCTCPKECSVCEFKKLLWV